jgi:nitrogen-specific signal transduction histidine kinase
MPQNKSISEVLTNNLFAGLDGAAVSTVFNSKNFIGEKEGNIIFQTGDESKFLYIVLEGEVKIKFSGGQGSRSPIKKGKNEFFGEKELIEGTPRISSAVADTDCILYALSRQEIMDLMSKYMVVRRNIYGIKDFDTQEELEAQPYSDAESDLGYSTDLEQTELKDEEEIIEEGTEGLSDEEEKDIGDEIKYDAAESEQNEFPETNEIQEFPEEPESTSPLEEEIQDPGSDETNVKWELPEEEPTPAFATEPKQDEYSESPAEEPYTGNMEETPEQQNETEKFILPSLEEEQVKEVSEEQKVEKENYQNFPELARYITNNIKPAISSLKDIAALIKRKNISGEINQVADMLSEQAESISCTIETAFDYALGKSSLNSSTTEFSDAVNKILSHLSEYVETRNVKLFKKIASEATVNIDYDRFYQACFQITKNACDAMPDGGNLYVTLRKEEGLMKLEFKDEGAGIPASIKEEVFEPFLSHGKSAGVGLGLTVAEKIIKDHGGTIKAEGETGEGTTIIITIPCEM